MKRPVLILIEIETEEFDNWREELPHDIEHLLSDEQICTMEAIQCFSFVKAYTFGKAVELLGEDRMFEDILEHWYKDEEEEN